MEFGSSMFWMIVNTVALVLWRYLKYLQRWTHISVEGYHLICRAKCCLNTEFSRLVLVLFCGHVSWALTRVSHHALNPGPLVAVGIVQGIRIGGRLHHTGFIPLIPRPC